MSLSRVKTWIPGDVLTAADLNAEFNNILNNPITLISPSTGAINFNSQAHTNLPPSALTVSTASTGSLLVVTSSGVPNWLAYGTAGQVLQITTSGTSPVWGTNSATLNVGNRVKALFADVGVTSSKTATFNAKQFLLQTTNSTQSFLVSSTVAFSIAITTSANTAPGAGTRDQAGAFASTSEIHWYMITTGQGSTTPAGIVSNTAPPTGPTLPSSYSAWTYLGSNLLTSAALTPGYYQEDEFFLNQGSSIFNSATPGTAEVAVSYSTAVPLAATKYKTAYRWGTGGTNLKIRINSSVDYFTNTPNSLDRDGGVLTLPVITTSQTFFFQEDTNVPVAFYILSYNVANH